jgi:hypothetical protein
MEAGFTVAIIVLMFVCFMGGVMVTRCMYNRNKYQGTIHVDYSDLVDGPHLVLESSVPISELVSRKRARLKIDVTQYVSHE